MILVTGHEPPDGFEANPSATLARRLNGEAVGGQPIRGAVLPTEPSPAGDAIVAAIDEHEPDIIVAAGFAPGRAGVVVERLAFTEGNWLAVGEEGEEIEDPDAPVGYVSTLSTEAIVEQFRKRDIPTTMSIAATSALSDRVLYDALAHVTEEEMPVAVGSLALPCTPEQAVRHFQNGAGEELLPSVDAETQLEALLVAVKLTVQHRQ